MSGMAAAAVRVVEPVEFGRVAVLCGGDSEEREVSLASGSAVLDALRNRDVDATLWDPSERSLTDFIAADFDRVWNALHGPGGEDGVVQGALDWLKVPYTGSRVMASALAMDKLRSKQLFLAAGIPTPDHRRARTPADAREAADELGFPLFVKPARQGSSIGMSKVKGDADLEEALALALTFDATALIERCIVGAEITVAILQGATLPSIRIETPRDYYDYHAKYEATDTRYICPGSDDSDAEARYAELALRAFQELDCAGWGRVDFMHADGDEPQVIEVNTVPGMTSHSLVPMAAKAAGIGFDELCWRVLETSLVADGKGER